VLHVGEDASANDEVDLLALFRVRVTAPLSRFLKAQYCVLDEKRRDAEPYTGRMASIGPSMHARHIGIGQTNPTLVTIHPRDSTRP